MKIKNKKSHKKAIIISSIVAVLLLGGGAYALRDQLGLTSSHDEAQFEEATGNDRQGETTAEQEQDQSNPDWNSSSDDNASKPDEQTPPDTTTPPADEVIISSINQDGNTLAIRTIIQPLVNGGQCTLAMSKVGQTPVRQTAGVQNMPSYSTCQGFNIDVSGMAKGSWNVEVTYTKDGKNKIGRGTAVIR